MQVSPHMPQVAFAGNKKRKLAGLAAAGLLLAGCSDGSYAAKNAVKDGFQRCESSNVSVEQHATYTRVHPVSIEIE